MTISARIGDAVGNTLLAFSSTPVLPTEQCVTSKLDVGFPSVREVSDLYPNADGAIDSTAFIGPSAVAWEGVIRPVSGGQAVSSLVDTLRSLVKPDKRLYLYFREDGFSAERRVLLRGAQYAGPLTRQIGPAVAVQAQWVNPIGIVESGARNALNVSPVSASGAEGGLAFATTSPGPEGLFFATTSPGPEGLAFSAGSVVGSSYVTNAGTARCYPVFDIYGYCQDPVITNLTTGAKLSFAGLTIQQGDFVEIDTRNHTILQDADPAQSVYNRLVFASSQWFGLDPGTSQLAFAASSPSSSCICVVSWRDAWI